MSRRRSAWILRLFLITEVRVSVLKESERPPGSSRYLTHPRCWIPSPFPHPQPDNVLYVVRRVGVTIMESGCYRYVSTNLFILLCSSLLSRTRTVYSLMYQCCLLSVLLPSRRKVLVLKDPRGYFTNRHHQIQSPWTVTPHPDPCPQA